MSNISSVGINPEWHIHISQCRLHLEDPGAVRGDPDHHVGFPAQRDAFANDDRIACESPLPKSLTDYRDARTISKILFWRKTSSVQYRQQDRVNKRRRHSTAEND